MVFVNCMDITECSNELYEKASHIVSEERRKKSERYHYIDDTKRCICAGLLLQYGLYHKVGQLGEIEITYNEFGKPFIKNRKEFKYNITHSGKWVAIAYGGTEVGIDVEKFQEGREELMDFCFSEEERFTIYNYIEKEEQLKQFTKLWTMKESYIKYLGTGLSTGLKSFSVDATKGLITCNDGELKKDLRIRSYQFATGYYLSVCSTEDEICIHNVSLKEVVNLLECMHGCRSCLQ
ncbi:MAG: 4'-phosphopantetheinyl transferase superfamily protein [Hungatella sp.]|nr:4'-phosphopantetheinyl transferase superfamily protein [Hungatella sp.]